ncbi:MAG: MFS transporter, partial [Myxococcales bacterium]|nr:MFS transporter [Myxococcales bacterium]
MTEPKLKQPRALYMLFFAEMWERFSFYGMRALLTLYLVRQLFAEMTATESDTKAKGIYAAYGALVYATPFVGGILADRVLGYKRSVMLGAVLMAIGHFVMAIETEFFLYVALAFLIVGNGFFKPNISS